MHYLFYCFFQNNEYNFWQNIKIQQKSRSSISLLPVPLQQKPFIYSLLQRNQMYPWSLGILCVIQKHPFLADTWSGIQALLARRMVTVIRGFWDRRKENGGGIKEFHKPLLIFEVNTKWHTYLHFLWILSFFFSPVTFFKTIWYCQNF